MTVKELIAELKKCPQDNIIMYDMGNAKKNDMLTIVNEEGEEMGEDEFPIDDVLIGGGTLKGFCFLAAELYEEVVR